MAGIAVLFLVVFWIAVVVGGVLTFWDSLVWLFNADWRTTNFQGFVVAATVALVSGIVGGVFLAMKNKLDEWRASLEEEIEMEKQLAASRRSKSKP